MIGTQKGGGKQHVPYEQPDNLESRQVLSLIDLLCEGEIAGPEEGLKNVYLNDTPIQSVNNDFNFKGIDAEWVGGTQGQAPLEGFPATENEVPVGLEVKKTTPIIRTITDNNIDRVRVTVGASSLIFQNESGDTLGTSVTMQIQVSSGSDWITKETVTIHGKTRSQFLKSVILSDLPNAPFNIRVIRITDDSTVITLQNKTIWSSYTEIYDIKLAYPNTAIAGLKFDSSQFTGVPRRNYLIKGLLLKIPDNYDPDKRSYEGMWTGNFKLGWTDNPAWILYDLITNDRYGMGNRVGQFGIDKFQLYTIARYCDTFVNDGFGGQEPRFTCNCYITNQKQAYDVITALCSVFRAIPVWDGTQFSAIIDRNTDPVALYTNANVVDGRFEYSSSARKDRHNAIHVKWVDKSNGWKGATEYVSDDASIAKNGLNVSQIEAFGCTSRGQAHRIGKWIIQTEKLEKKTVNFVLGREGLRHLPGDIIIIVDNTHHSAKTGGRIIDLSENTVTLDRDVSVKTGDIFTYADRNGKPKTTTVQAQIDPRKITTAEAIDAPNNSVYAINDKNGKQLLFKTISISENSDETYKITALEHNHNKEAIVDEAAVFDPNDGGLMPKGIPSVDALAVEVVPESNNFQARLTWRVPRTIVDLKFEVKFTRDGNVVSRNIVKETADNISELGLGNYIASIRGIDGEGRVGQASQISFSIAPPIKPVGLVLQPDVHTVTIIPKAAPGTNLGTYFEFYKGSTIDEVLAKKNYIGRGLTIVDGDCLPDTIYFYGANSINAVGRSEMITGNTRTLTENESGGGAGGFFRVQTDDGIFPPIDEQAIALFVERFKINPQIDTVMIVYSLDKSGQISHTESKMYDGGKWVKPALFLDGDLIATGTIKGDRITAGTEISAPKIKGGELNINDRFTVDTSGNVKITQQSGAAGMTVTNNAIKIFDETGRLVVQIGNLTE